MPEFVQRPPQPLTPQQIPSQAFMESQQFYQTIGYPEYGGKYAPFETPTGYKLSQIQETPEGLSIMFEGPPKEIPIIRGRGFQEKIEYPPSYEYVVLPEPKPIKGFGFQEKVEHPPAYEYVIQPQKPIKGFGYQEIADYSPPMTQHEKMQALYITLYKHYTQLEEGKAFYTGLGYPQYASKYAPFTIPEGYKVKDITETPTGLDVSFEGKSEYVPTSLFGPKMLYYNAEKDEWTEQVTPTLKVKVVPGFGLSPHEQQAMLGISLVGAVAYPVVIPQLVVPASIAIGVGESVKYGITGEHLTVSEIISSAGIGELVGLTVLSLAPSKIGREIGYQFKQHAPESILKVVYGKQMGSAIAIERQWSWGTSAAKGTAGMLEESFGMPFYRAETLHYAMPTLEWERVRFMEWMAPRVYAESAFGWEAKALGLKAGELVQTSMIHPETFRTAESLHMNVPTIRKIEQWYIRISGFTRTPMEVTLQRATEQKLFGALSRGGLSSNQILDLVKGTKAPSQLNIPTAPTRLYTQRDISTFYFGPEQLKFPSESMLLSWMPPIFRQTTKPQSLLKRKIVPFTIAMPQINLAQFTRSFSITRTTQVLTQTQRQRQAQIQIPLQIQRLSLDVPTPTIPKLSLTIPTPGFSIPTPSQTPFPKLPSFPQFHEPNIRRMNRGLFGAWGKRTHALPTERQIMSQLGYGTRRRRHIAKRRTHKRKR